MNTPTSSRIPMYRPIQINNETLADTSYPQQLKPGLETQEYQLIPYEAWMELVKWYGGGPEFTREVIETEQCNKIEYYPPLLYIKFTQNKRDTWHKLCFSKQTTINNIIRKIVTRKPHRFTLYLKQNSEFTLLDRNKSLEDYQIDNLVECIVSDVSLDTAIPQDALEPLPGYRLRDSVEYQDNGI